MNEGRFVRVFAESPFSIWVDRETGVNYLYGLNGITPLLNADGKPVVTPLT